MKKYLLILSVLSLTLTLTKADAQTLKQRLEIMEKKQQELEQKLEQSEAKNKETAPSNVQVGIGKEGFYLQSIDKKYSLKFKGLLQFDGRYFLDLPKEYGQTTFVARRARPYIEGKVAERFKFRFMPDFGGGNATILDAYLDINIFPELNFRLGKHKVMLGMERIQPSDVTRSTEFAFPTGLTPDYDLGINMFGKLFDGIVEYNVGVYNGVPDGGRGDLDFNNGKDVVGRVLLQPFAKTDLAALKNLSLGVAASYGRHLGSTSNTLVPTYKTPGQQTMFRYISSTSTSNFTIADGTLWRVTPQLYYNWGPFSLMGEYIRSTQGVTNNSGKASFTHQAWQAITSFVLTGEDASFSGVKVKRPLNPKKGQWGAVELAARYHGMDIDNDVFPNYALTTQAITNAQGYGVSVNWYLNDNIRINTSFDHTFFHSGATTGGDRPSEKVLFSRFQLAF